MTTEPDEKPKQNIEIYKCEYNWYQVSDLLVIMKNRSKKLRYYLGSEIAGFYRPPFEIPLYLQRAEENDETLTNKQRRKLMKRYMHEWNYYMRRCTKETMDIPDLSLMRN